MDDLTGEPAVRSLPGPLRRLVAALAVGLSLYAWYWVVDIVQPQIYRTLFLLVALVLTFLLFPARRRSTNRVTVMDWLAVAATVAALGWPLVDFDRFVYRAATPTPIDLTFGAIAVVLVLEATRRTVGWILPVTAAVFILYGWLGPFLDLVGLRLIAHRGYALDRLVGSLYMTLEGIFGVPLEVAATYIILFSIYGAVLEYSGAGRFFLDWALAAFGRSGRASGAGRTVTAAGFLLGTVSGSGVATTVTLGSVAWPLLRQSGYAAETGGAILSAAGIGALLSPPTLGAAAFLIAEFLDISYLDVLVMASIPTILYYAAILLMIEADSRAMHTGVAAVEGPSVWTLTRRYGYHFSSLIAIAILMIVGLTAFSAVFWATVLAIGLSFLRTETALGPRRLARAFEAGGISVLGVAATTATAGIIVGVVTLTGLGLKVAGLIVTLAAGSLVLTVVYAALAVLVLGLAVPVTASYIIAAVMIAPALTTVGVAPVAAHMFIFYYAVLSEVSPPTALSPFAAAALTGGNPFKTMMLTWKYTLPAFLVPFVFTLSPDGLGVLLRAPWPTVVWTTVTALVGVGALAAGLGGWIMGPLPLGRRVAATAAGLALFYAHPIADAIGVTLFVAVIAAEALRVRKSAAAVS
jgi:TRAP transporter 4TM/12TM fusion protein